MRRYRMIAALALAGALLGAGCGASVASKGVGVATTAAVPASTTVAPSTTTNPTSTTVGPSTTTSGGSSDCVPGDASPAGVAQATKTFIPFVEAIKSGDQACADKLVSDWYVARLKVTLNDPHDPAWITFQPPGGYPSLEDRFKQLKLPINPAKITDDSYSRPIVVENGQSAPESTDQPQPTGLTLSYPFGKGHLEVDLVDENGTYLVDGITMNLFQP